jgi:hypothetical protein
VTRLDPTQPLDTREAVRARYGEPNPRVVAKELRRLDRHVAARRRSEIRTRRGGPEALPRR